MNQTIIDTIAPRLTELVIKKIETLTSDWQKPWIADMTHGLPRNLRGTPYRAGNVLMLLFLSEIMGYRTPVFMTFRSISGRSTSAIRRPARRSNRRNTTACRRSSRNTTT